MSSQAPSRAIIYLPGGACLFRTIYPEDHKTCLFVYCSCILIISLLSEHHNMTSRVVIVTGGADGFGAAIADRFSQEGCTVILLDMNREKGESKASRHANMHFLYGDVTQRETWEEASAVAREKYGRVDVVVNNAGVTGNQELLHAKNMAEYEKTFNVNVKVGLNSFAA